MVIDVIIFGPFVEEIIFRFVIFKLAGFRLRSVFISMLVFGLAHVILLWEAIILMSFKETENVKKD